MSNYGTAGRDTRHSHAGSGTDEEDALLPRKDVQLPISTRLVNHLTVEVDPKHGDLILLLCYVITGLLDSCATAEWGSFVSMQTGNTVYVGLGLAHPQSSTRWIKGATSIISFCFGSFCFARFHRTFGQRRRWVVVGSFIIQFVMVVVAAILTSFTDYDKTDELSWHLLVPLAMVAFQSSGQAVMSRALSYGGLTSVVLTSIYCDLFSDAQLFAWPTENVERNRRAAAPILLLIGALVGGLWAQTEIGLSGALWTAAVLKGLIVCAWLLWKPKPESEDC